MEKQMNPADTINTLKTKLAEVLSRSTSVRSAYVFGSVALGLDSDRSDVDMAIRVDPNLSSQEAFELRLTLMDELETAVDRRVDVVLLNSASLKMIHQVVNSGKLIYAVIPEEEMLYAIQKRKEYFDFRYYLDRERLTMNTFFSI